MLFSQSELSFSIISSILYLEARIIKVLLYMLTLTYNQHQSILIIIAHYNNKHPKN